MIEAVKGSSYPSCSILKSQLKDERQAIEEGQILDPYVVLEKIEAYTYRQEETREMSEEQIEGMRRVWELEEEELETLYREGVDITQLQALELNYYQKNTPAVKQSKKVGEASLEDKLTLIGEEKDCMYLNTLNTQGPISVQTLYENCFKGNVKKGGGHYTKEDVSNVLKLNGIEETSSSSWAADLLMMYDMGVSTTAVTKLQNIQSAVSSLKLQETGKASDELLMKDEERVYEPETIDRITDDLGMVTDEHIEKLIEEGEKLNISTLRESIHKKAGEALQHQEQGTSHQEGQKEGTMQQVEEVKRDILQITARLTVEAAQKISGRMPLESSSLSAVANALREMEEAVAVEALEAVEAPVTHENKALIVQTMTVVEQMTTEMVHTLKVQLETDEKLSMKELGQALKCYGENETPVEKRFGETLSRVEGQIEGFLEKHGMEPTPIAIEAGKALIAGGMEISKEHVAHMGEIVLKVQTFLEEMTPVQAANMIKEGINPYNATVDQLLINIGSRKLKGLQKNVAEAIVAMRKSGEINEGQEKEMINLYRVLQGVRKEQPAVLAYLYKNELPMTLENLQRAVKYSKDKNHKVWVAEGALKKDDQAGALLYAYVRKQFKKQMGERQEEELPEEWIEKLETIRRASPALLQKMLEENIPVTLDHVYWMDQLMKDESLYARLLQENALPQDFPETLEEAEKQTAALLQQVEEGKEEAMNEGDVPTYGKYKQLEELATLQQQRMEKESVYQIPLMIHGEQRLVNLYLYKEPGGKGKMADESALKALITYETRHLGKVKAYVTIQEQQIDFKIEGESSEATSALEAHRERLVERLKGIGYATSDEQSDNEPMITNEGYFEMRI